MRPLLIVALCVVTLGCRTVTPPPARAPIEGTELGELSEGGGVATLPYPSEGLVRVSLFIDAGSRDTEVPTTATIAAELAAELAGAHAFVSPDAIELSLTGERDELEAMVARLGEALAIRSVDAGALARVTQLVADRRLQALGSSERAAVSRSLSALLGPETAASLDPLGGGPPAASDGELQRFFAAHFGAERALLVITGDVDKAEAERVYARARAGWPAASEGRTVRPPLEPRFGAATEIGRRASVALSAALPSLAAAEAAEGVLASTGAPGERFVYALRGGALLTLALDGPREPDALRSLAVQLLRAADVASAVPRVVSRVARSPFEAARALGLAWATRAPVVAASEPAVGVGVSVPGGRADSLSAEEPDAAALAAAKAALETSLEHIASAARPSLTPVAASPGAFALPNGARVRVTETATGTAFGLAIALEGAIAEEPSSARGRAALIAEALSIQCGRALGVGEALSPFAEAQAVGLLFVAPPEGWAQRAAQVLDCVLSAPLDARAIEDGRVALLSRLSQAPDSALMAAVSRALAPNAPGAVWPLGTPRSIARLRSDAIPATLTQLRVGRRVRVALMGPVASEPALRFLAATVSTLPEGTAPRALRLGTPAAGPVPIDEASRTYVTAGLRLSPRDAAAARAYADAYAEALSAAGLSVAFARGGGGAEGAWVAVRVDASPSSLPAVAAQLEALRPSAEQLSAHLASRSRAERWAAATPGPRSALSLIEAAPAPQGADPSALEPTAVVLLVGRPQPDEAMERVEGATR